jgi:thioester reductase-like protein
VTGALTADPRVEAAIAAVAARYLRPGAAFDPDVPLALLGIDSLKTIEMAVALEETLGCDVAPELLADCADARTLAVLLTQLREGRVVGASDDPFAEMLADAVLPPDVRPPERTAVTGGLGTAHRILLTGATGFLGRALLDELLERSAAEIVCLVRSHACPTAPARVRVVTGDLSRPLMGLTPADFNRLAGEVDAVVHCGAMVNWVYAYSSLRAANVLGTLELLRLASARGIPFHFISSMSVCYPSEGPRLADERFDGLAHLRGVHLGYAQTKVVAEALVRQAHGRGLPARIYRPALITGDSRTGAYNRDDLISALVRGCVQMGTAPDLDWKLDCQPVDHVAKAIVALSDAPESVLHLGHHRPRHWRECVLWMRMYGYPLRLVPYHAWLRQLDRETGPLANDAATHPLRPLRTFFLERPSAAGLTLPELYEETRRTHADSSATCSVLKGKGIDAPPIDASLLETYFAALRKSGDLPSLAAPRSRTSKRAAGALKLDADLLSELLARQVRAVRILDTGSDHSIVSELTAWRSGRTSGLFRLKVDFADESTQAMWLKLKAADSDVIAVGRSLGALVDPALGDAYAQWGDRIGLAMSHRREVEIYRQTDARFVNHTPRVLGSILDDKREVWAIALEDVESAVLRDSAENPHAWESRHIRAALDGLASLHAIWYGREAELRSQPWIGHVASTASVVEMTSLWRALARHAAPAFSSWAHPDMSTIQERLIGSIADWRPSIESAPQTLIHHDFNPRNLCLHADNGRLITYDWELATIGAPQRDLVEFLCFVLPPDIAQADLHAWMEYYRTALEHATCSSIDTDTWKDGFRSALFDLLLNRLAVYAVVNRVRAQPFLPRVVATWRRLYELTVEMKHE